MQINLRTKDFRKQVLLSEKEGGKQNLYKYLFFFSFFKVSFTQEVEFELRTLRSRVV